MAVRPLAQIDEPGILLVLAQPTRPEYSQAFHEWYDTEHGPARLKLGKKYFLNGLRYRTEDKIPIWLASYDMPKLSMGADPKYTSLRENRSKREQAVLRKANNVMLRQFLRLVSKSGHTPPEPAPSIICVNFKVQKKFAAEACKWYIEVSFPSH